MGECITMFALLCRQGQRLPCLATAPLQLRHTRERRRSVVKRIHPFLSCATNEIKK